MESGGSEFSSRREELASKEQGEPASDAEALGESEVYAMRRVHDRDGSVIAIEETGALTRDIGDRAARPWLYRAEPLTYGDDSWSVEHPDGTVERNYRVFSRPNLEPWTPTTTTGVPEISEPLVQRLEHAAPDETVTIIAELRDYPEWDIPLRSTTAASSPEDEAAAIDNRANAMPKTWTVRAISYQRPGFAPQPRIPDEHRRR